VALGGPKQRALLAELLLHRGEVVSRDHLVDAVWGDRPPASASGSLQVYVHGLRRALGRDRIETHGTGYRVKAGEDELDLTRFERLLGTARDALAAGDPAGADERLAEALGLWRGEPLADLTGGPVASAAGHLGELRLQALELLHDARLALGEDASLVPGLEELIAAEPYRERLRAQHALALYRAGRQKEALDACRAARRVLVDGLGMDPGAALQELERAILNQDTSLLRSPADAAPAPPARARRLPLPASSLVGRRLEVAAVSSILRREDVRLVTLTGPGGTGKTRLALAVAHAAAEDGPRDGAAFVDLSAITDAGLVLAQIAQALEIADAGELLGRLRGSELLLVLDNLEQLADAVEPIATLLREAPGLRILATSRTPVRLTGEHEYAVPPLPVADPGRPFEEIAACEAVVLFAERARAVDAAFALDAATAPLVARICARLDGLPLAIELAAARVRALPLAAIEPRLECALDLLVDGARDLPERQRTLRATLDWSHALLGDAEQALLARLAVFAGGFTLDLLERVFREDAALELAALVDASLVRRRADRFSLLETIREYALARLRERGEDNHWRARHAAEFLALAEEARRWIMDGGAKEAEGLELLETEQDNMRAALGWAAREGDVETEVRLLAAHRWFWLVRGRMVEARQAFLHAVEVSSGDDALHATALNGAALFASRQGDLDEARRQWTDALVLYRRLGDESEIARCTAELGGVEIAAGNFTRAKELYTESVEIFDRIGERGSLAAALSNLASVAVEVDDLETAIDFGVRAVELQREVDDRGHLSVSLANLAPILLASGRAEDARSSLAEAIELGVELGHTLLLAHCLTAAADLARHDGDAPRAARLVGAAEAAFDAMGMPAPDAEAATHERTLALCRTLLGGADVAALVDEGRALGAETALDEARGATGRAAAPS
jgi:predicted ATPase/DNA-binding SARP family transcriptional activator